MQKLSAEQSSSGSPGRNPLANMRSQMDSEADWVLNRVRAKQLKEEDERRKMAEDNKTNHEAPAADLTPLESVDDTVETASAPEPLPPETSASQAHNPLLHFGGLLPYPETMTPDQ